MELVHKVLDFELGPVDEKRRAFWAVASTGAVDRAGDEIAPEGWVLDNFMQNPVIPWAHDYARPPVAKALEVKAKGPNLVFLAQFPRAEEYAFADTVYRLYRGGYLKAFSVGFCPLQTELVTRQHQGRTIVGTRYLKQELYEISCVTLPANPQALVAQAAERIHPSQTPDPPQPAKQLVAPELSGLLWDQLILGRMGGKH